MTQRDLTFVEQALHRLTTTEKLTLIKRLAGMLQVTSTKVSPQQQQQSLRQLQQELSRLPVMNPADGFSNQQHDQVLYDRFVHAA